MRTICSFSLVIAALFAPPRANGRQIIFPKPLSPRNANYTISVVLDAQKKTLTGKETLIWRNISRDRIRELRFHLYLNAFKNTRSTFLVESGGQLRGVGMEAGGWGWIDVQRMRVANGEDLTSRIEFIHPDDDNTQDQTVIRVPLREPVLPNHTIALDIDFTARLPHVFARTGYDHDYFMVGQWFPKIGVYEPAGMRYSTSGQWNCHQFHANTEFYADYGTYDVRITVPQTFVVGAVGVLQSSTKNADSTRTDYYRAEDVHDFSWAASPLFKVVEDQWRNVKIRLLIQPDRLASQGPRYLQSVKATLQYFHDWVGEYPYPTITIIDPQWGAGGSGGMEYPTLITGLSLWNLPSGIRLVEEVTVHEFGHQYWYGMVGSNEFEEAWLDEGINQYSETRIMDDTYGKKSSSYDILGYRASDFETARADYAGMSNPKLYPTQLNAWDYKEGGYGGFTYMKTATFLTTLERMIGRPVMDEIMRTYFERWKFRHPCAKDFIAVVNEIVPKRLGTKFGPNMNWFFNQVLYGTDVCDYELTKISVERTSSLAGTVDRNGKKVEERGGLDEKKMHESRVLVSRLGEVKMPVDVLVHFADGKEKREHWDGQDRSKEFRYIADSGVEWAVVDPDEVLAIDVNTLNNSKSEDPPSAPVWKYTAKFLFWVENAIQLGNIF
ncbi:MAG TPA: M1 family metallopeptidase [Bacteroidota bacterium]|nr:M1 family metallopeptidase [Bacteroidota bacterium]